MNDPARTEIDDEECEDRPEPQIVKLEEVARPYFAPMIVEKRRPRLSDRTGRVGSPHVPLDRPLAHMDADFEQFTPNSLGAPEVVFPGEPLDHANRFGGDTGSWWSVPRLLPPKAAKARSVPAKDRFRFHEQECIPPSGQDPRKSRDQRALAGEQSGPLRASRRHDELLTQQGVLGDELASRADYVSEQPANHGSGLRGARRGEAGAARRVPAHETTNPMSDGREHEPDLTDTSALFKSCGQRARDRSWGGRDDYPRRCRGCRVRQPRSAFYPDFARRQSW